MSWGYLYVHHKPIYIYALEMAVTNDHRDVECILNVTKSVIYQHVRALLYPSLLQCIVVCHMMFSAGYWNIKCLLVNCVVSTAKRPSTINALYLKLGYSTLCWSRWLCGIRRGSVAVTGLLRLWVWIQSVCFECWCAVQVERSLRLADPSSKGIPFECVCVSLNVIMYNDSPL